MISNGYNCNSNRLQYLLNTMVNMIVMQQSIQLTSGCVCVCVCLCAPVCVSVCVGARTNCVGTGTENGEYKLRMSIRWAESRAITFLTVVLLYADHEKRSGRNLLLSVDDLYPTDSL